MSVRVVNRLFKHATNLVRIQCKRNLGTTNIAEKINAAQQVTQQPTKAFSNQVVSRNFGLRNVGIQLGIQARKILIDNVLSRVTNSLASELRKKAARRILYGDSGPFFALVGVSLASGTGILTKEEELEGVCCEIRNAISKIKWMNNDIDVDETLFESSPILIENLTFGKPIAKGANAVVYAANIKNNEASSPVEDAQIVGKPVKICPENSDDIEKYPLALKMMFNYDIQSSAMAILNAMYRETVPARQYYSNLGVTEWEIELSKRHRHLPPHPNVVSIFSVFTDYVPELEDCRELYPAALPKKIHPEGEGRNMSLFLLMKRYRTNLQDYFSASNPLSTRTSILLFSQLLEAVAHLTANSIAHRDLKSDNLLLDFNEPDVPILVLSDFGCCLADKSNGLMLPYTSYDVDKGGNTALMAPEIINQQPGTFSVLNYTKSDLWAAGAIAYEIFGCVNPFYGTNKEKLSSASYKEEELPDLPDEVPPMLRSLIRNCLSRNPNKRLDTDVAANVCQLFLWAPSSWLNPGIKLPSSTEVLQWLLSLTTKILCEGRIHKSNMSMRSDLEGNPQHVGRRTYPEYLLISSFLCRAKLYNIKSALSWIQSVNYEIDY